MIWGAVTVAGCDVGVSIRAGAAFPKEGGRLPTSPFGLGPVPLLWNPPPGRGTAEYGSVPLCHVPEGELFLSYSTVFLRFSFQFLYKKIKQKAQAQ